MILLEELKRQFKIEVYNYEKKKRCLILPVLSIFVRKNGNSNLANNLS